MLLLAATSKEAPYVPSHPPPRPPIDRSQLAAVVPLEQLWTRLSPTKQHELLAQLTRILAQRLTPPTGKEEADE